MVLWLLSLIRPRLFLRFGVGSCILFLIMTHADFFGYALSMFGRHQPGIEADWSCPPWLFPKLFPEARRIDGATARSRAFIFCALSIFSLFPPKKCGTGSGHPGGDRVLSRIPHLGGTLRFLFRSLFRLRIPDASQVSPRVLALFGKGGGVRRRRLCGSLGRIRLYSPGTFFAAGYRRHYLLHYREDGVVGEPLAIRRYGRGSGRSSHDLDGYGAR